MCRFPSTVSGLQYTSDDNIEKMENITLKSVAYK